MKKSIILLFLSPLFTVNLPLIAKSEPDWQEVNPILQDLNKAHAGVFEYPKNLLTKKIEHVDRWIDVSERAEEYIKENAHNLLNMKDSLIIKAVNQARMANTLVLKMIEDLSKKIMLNLDPQTERVKIAFTSQQRSAFKIHMSSLNDVMRTCDNLLSTQKGTTGYSLYSLQASRSTVQNKVNAIEVLKGWIFYIRQIALKAQKDLINYM